MAVGRKLTRNIRTNVAFDFFMLLLKDFVSCICFQSVNQQTNKQTEARATERDAIKSPFLLSYFFFYYDQHTQHSLKILGSAEKQEELTHTPSLTDICTTRTMMHDDVHEKFQIASM